MHVYVDGLTPTLLPRILSGHCIDVLLSTLLYWVWSLPFFGLVEFLIWSICFPLEWYLDCCGLCFYSDWNNALLSMLAVQFSLVLYLPTLDGVSGLDSLIGLLSQFRSSVYVFDDIIGILFYDLTLSMLFLLSCPSKLTFFVISSTLILDLTAQFDLHDELMWVCWAIFYPFQIIWHFNWSPSSTVYTSPAIPGIFVRDLWGLTGFHTLSSDYHPQHNDSPCLTISISTHAFSSSPLQQKAAPLIF